MFTGHLIRTAALLACVAPLLAAQSADSYRENPEFTKHFDQAKLAARRSDGVTTAISEYEKAYKVSNGECIQCLEKIEGLAMHDTDYKRVMRTAEMIEAAPTATDSQRADAKLQRVLAMLRKEGEKHKPATLAAAETAMHDARGLQPNESSFVYQHGKVLAEMGRMDEAANAFREYLKLAPQRDALRTRVAKFAVDPALSLRTMAPPFQLTTMDGKRFNLDAMGGRVVLIDFWATWCGPCNEELPHMRRLAKQFENEPFVLLSVSSDSDADKWRAFVQKESMTWSQYRDSTRQLSKVFAVSSIPRYFTIDSDGVLQSVNVGSGSDIDGRLRSLVAKAKKDMAAAAKASDHGE